MYKRSSSGKIVIVLHIHAFHLIDLCIRRFVAVAIAATAAASEFSLFLLWTQNLMWQH